MLPDPLRSYMTSANGLRLRATWRSGYATVCKTVYTGSIPVVASNRFGHSAEIGLKRLQSGEALL